MNIKEKIAKLLALAESPNENEAKAALLKARELMVQHKLRPEECVAKKKEEVIRKVFDDIKCTTMTDFWIYKMAGAIAEHYCCKSYCIRKPRAKALTIAMIGLESDMELCERVLRYAINCVQTEQRNIRRMKLWKGYSSTEIRLACNAYGDGFVSGLNQAYQEQDAEHKEWGLVMTTPQSVQDAYGGMKMRTTNVHAKRAGSWANDIRDQGLQAGKSFNTNNRVYGASIAN